MSSINFTCDSCGREVLGCTFVNGMKFCAKCYQETFGNTLTTEQLLEFIKNSGWDIGARDDIVVRLDTKAHNIELQKKVADLEAKLAEKDDELLQKERRIQDLMLCEFVSTTLDFNKLSADNCRLREQLAEMEANKEKEINRICKTHIEANAKLKQQLAEKEEKITELQSKLNLKDKETNV